MTSSGIKRGVATAAVSALAVAGLPFLAGTAQAVPNADQMQGEVWLLTQGETSEGAGDQTKYDAQTITDVNDGTNSTASLVAGGPASVTSVVFEYSTNGTTWTQIGDVQARNADGVFATEWAIPDSLNGTSISLRVVPNTGLAHVATVTGLDVSTDPNDAVELGTEGSVGIYQNELTDLDNVAVRGTVSKDFSQPSVMVFDLTRDINGVAVGTTASVETDDAGNKSFEGVLQYDATGPNGYPYASDTSANQAVLAVAGNLGEDSEGVTYYVQSVASVTATPKQTQVTTGAKTPVTVTIVDQNGAPVAGATVGFVKDNAAPTADVDTSNVGTTDANGQLVYNTGGGLGAGTYVFYADDDATAGHSAGDVDAAPFTITEYNAQISSVAISNQPAGTVFDFDEMDDNAFTITAKDQNNNPMVGQPIQYRWVMNPSQAGLSDYATAWTAAGTTNAEGKATAVFQSTPGAYTNAAAAAAAQLWAGDYTLEARRPNVSGTGLTNATPVTYEVNESEIKFTDGASANAPVNGSYTATGNLALIGGGSDLAGRTVTLSLVAGGDSSFAPQAEQPAGTTRTGAYTATAETDADGNFSVVIKDPSIPPNVTPVREVDTLTAVATALRGTIGRDGSADTLNASLDSAATLTVNFEQQPEVGRIVVNDDVLDDYSYWSNGTAAPGSPVALDITVYAADDTPNDTSDDVELQDFPVDVSVDKGFLTPFAENEEDLTLTDGEGDEGDLWGFFQDLGADEQVSTGDAAEAGITAAIEADADFDDDGLAEQTVTITAGDVTETVDITYDVRNFLNMVNVSLERAAGEPAGDVTVGERLDFQLYVEDQYGNLVGDHFADVFDDSTVADVTTDGLLGATETDFITDQPGIFATSPAETVQTLTTRIGSQEVLVDGDGLPDWNNRTVTESSDPINWVGKRIAIDAHLNGKSNGAKADRLKVNAPDAAAGATVKLFKVKKNGKKVLVKTATLNDNGNKKFKVADKNGRKFTKYVAKVKKTAATQGDRTNTKRVR